MEPNILVDQILNKSIDLRASDVHIEPLKNVCQVRFRIDGLLYNNLTLEKYIQEKLISCIKIKANISISEHRLPQDGHLEFIYKDKIYDIRVSTLQTIYGEAIVMRILNRHDILIKLEKLGMETDQLDILNKVISCPSGMTLITGPTGAGKSFLLYSILNRLNKPEKNIITVEDPIELQIDHIRQTQVNEEIGLTFNRVLRSVIRQDPDVIMLGEIRDSDTALQAVQASLTGILVLSTFHTFDIPALVTRFYEMGISISVITQALTSVISVRLVRKICHMCRQDTTLSDFDKLVLKGIDLQHYTWQKGKGCTACNNTGYLGRTGIFELVYLDDEIKTFIIDKQPFENFNNLLIKKQIKKLREAAINKVLLGETTLDELVRVLGPTFLLNQSLPVKK